MTQSSTNNTGRLPDVGAGFVWDTVKGAFGLRYPTLRASAEPVLAAFSTRQGGLCPQPYDSLHVGWGAPGKRGGAPHPYWDDLVLCNRQIAAGAIDADDTWFTARQVHGGEVVKAAWSSRRRDADSVWTDVSSRVVAVIAADCVLVLLVAAGRVAVAHAGWKGLLAGVVQNAARTIEARAAWIGPSIGPCCYKVGRDVLSRFDRAFHAPQMRLDLWSAAAQAASDAGVPTVHVARVCTSCNRELFFSHRRDRGRTGRQALVARLP